MSAAATDVTGTACPAGVDVSQLILDRRAEHPNALAGLVFRFQDIDNFYFVLLHDNGNPAAPFRYRLIGRKQAGAFSFLESGGADDTAGYTPNTWFTLRLAVSA